MMREYTIRDVLKLLQYSHTKFSIVEMFDDGSEQVVLEDKEYSTLKFDDIFRFIDEEVYCISARDNKVIIYYCDPDGEWK